MMKTKLFFLLTLLLFWKAEAQVISFADLRFKNKLLTATRSNLIAKDLNNVTCAVDTNGDGEIQLSEAENISYLYLNSSNISDFEGLQYFVNLVTLYNQLNSVDATIEIKDLPKLKTLNLFHNAYTYHFSNLPSLESINLDMNYFTSLSVQDLPKLTTLTSSYAGNLKTIDVKNLPLLSRLDFSLSGLENVVIDNFPNLEYVNFSNSKLLSISFNNVPILEIIDLGNNKLTSFDASMIPNVKTLNLTQNSLTSLSLI